MTDSDVGSGYVPGVVGRLTTLHASYYGDRWELGPAFEAEIAAGLSSFLARYDPGRDGLLTVRDDGTVMGGIVVDGRDGDRDGAQLRYFILDPALHGRGLGRALLDRAMTLCRERGYDRVFLWTVDELEAAVHLYRDAGFEPTDVVEVHTDWRTDVPYRLFEYEQ